MSVATILTAVMLALAAATAIGALLVRQGFPLPKGARIGHVDGLRGYLALSVMAHHYVIWVAYKAGQPWDDPALNLYKQFGKTAVAMFFMATGLVFYPRIVSGLRNTNWIALYNGRIFRIVPMLLFSALVCSVVTAVEYRALPGRKFPYEVTKWILGWQGSLLGVDMAKRINAGVLWSIWWEWVFYFAILPVFAALALPLKRGRLWLMLVAVFAISLAGRTFGFKLFTFLPLFIIGMFAAEAVARPRLKAWLGHRWMAIPALAIIPLVMTLWPDPYGVIQMALLGLVFASIACGNDLLGLLSNSGARMLGEISFSIYVLHGIVLHIAFRTLPVEVHPLVDVPLLFMAVTLIAATTFLGIERPFMALGRTVYARLQRPRAAMRA